MKRRVALLGAAVALLLTSACSSAPNAAPGPSSSTASASTSQTTAQPSANTKAAESSSPTTGPVVPGEAPPSVATPNAPASPASPAATDSEAPPVVAPTNNPPPASADGCVPSGNGIPTTAKDFDCLNLVAVSGTDASGDITWLGSYPFTLVSMLRDGNVTFSSKTPCNTLMSSVQVTDTQFIVDPNMAKTLMSCQSPQSDYEGWVSVFFSSPLDYTTSPDSLVLTNDHGTVTFKVPAP